MKKMLAIFFSLAISLSFGQNRLKVIDSLKNALAIAKLDTDRVLIKVGLAEMYALVNVDSALVYSESALDISRKISFIEGEAAAYDMLGWTFHNIGNHALSLDMYYKSLNFAEKNHLTRLKGAALMMIGLIYKDEYSDFDKALNYIYQAKALFTLIHYNRNITVCESMIGSIYTKKNQIDSAEFYLRLAETHEAQYNLNFNYVIWGYFALLYKAEGNPEKALEYLKQAAKLAYFNGDYANCSDYNIRIAEIYMGQNLRDSAIYFASRALEDTKKSISYPYIIQSSRILHTLYKDINPTKALYYNEITLAAEDSLYKSSKSNSLNNVIDFEEKEQEYEIEKSQKNYQSQVRLKLFLFGIGVFLLIGFILYKNNQDKQKANQVLQNQKTKLENVLAELELIQKQLIEKEKIATSAATRLQELDAVKTKLYTNITHEFRTPLTVILGMAEQMSVETRHALSLRMITRNGQNLLTLVNQMLDLSKLESGNLKLNYQQNDIVRFIRYVSESFHSLAENKGLVINFYSEIEHFDMVFDEIRLQQIISNLLSNALKFTLKNGRIDVSFVQLEMSQETSRQQEKPNDVNLKQIALTVKDTGIGIDKKDLPHIFDRFYQADSSSVRSSEGTGIGLALTQELVKLMDGTISVKSILGEGSEFSIILPILADSFSLKDDRKTQISDLSGFMDRHDLNYQPYQNEELSYSSENLETTINEKLSTILVADDNADVQTYIASVLSPDYNLLMAKNGQECEDLAFETIPDLIISDVMMPIKDGFEICKTLKSDERTSHIPIILLTAKADVESKLLGLAHGADVYLMKPFHKEELLMRIKKLLELRQQLQKHYLSALSNEPLALSNEHLNSSDSKAHSSLLIAHCLENAFVKKVKTVVEAHLTDTKFDVEVLERALNLSHSQLHRKLTALTGLSANSFIRSIKLIKAKELLLHSPYSIQAIAFDSGFNEQAYFSRVFKQEFGETPQAWRERNS